MAHAYGYTIGYTMGLVLPCFYWQHFPCYTGKRNGEALPERAIPKASRSVDRGSSDCFQTINVLEQELVFPWCG